MWQFTALINELVIFYLAFGAWRHHSFGGWKAEPLRSAFAAVYWTSTEFAETAVAMTEKTEDLETRLLRRARDKSQQGRGALLEDIAELFVGGDGRLSDQERSLLSDILTKLIHEVEMDVRRDIAARLSDIEAAPRELIVMLANDDVEVAGPILLKSGVLRDADLMEIFKHRSTEHRLKIAGRNGLSEEVADALIENGEEDVIEALLNNGDAVLSRRASEYLVEESRRIDRFQEPLLRRPDLPPDLGHRMFWWVSAALRKHILEAYAIDESALDEVIQESSRSPVGLPPAPKTRASQAEKLVSDLADRGELSEQFLLRSLRQQYASAFTAGLARMADLDPKMAQRIVFDPGGEALTVACKAIGMDRAVFAPIFLLVRQIVDGSGAKDATVVEHVLRIYDRLAQDRARHVLRFWQRDADYIEAIFRISSAVA